MTTATIETLTAAVTTARANLDAAIAAATQWTGQGEVAFCRGELTRAEKALDAAQPAAVEKAAADAASLAEYEAFKAAQLAERAAARKAAMYGTTTYRPAARASQRSRCACGHCMACIGE
jgi:hypothetical protein